MGWKALILADAFLLLNDLSPPPPLPPPADWQGLHG